MERNKSESFFRNPQNVIALAVSIISICALVVSIKQTQIMSEQRVLMYEQSKASVWPRLEVGLVESHNLDDYSISTFKLNVNNGGVGPAIVKSVRVTFDGKIVKYWGDLFEEFDLPKGTRLFYGNRDLNNSIIKIGENFSFLILTENLPVAQGFYDNLEKVKIEIWYESIYGDKWMLTYNKNEAITSEVDSKFTLPEEEEFKN